MAVRVPLPVPRMGVPFAKPARLDPHTPQALADLMVLADELSGLHRRTGRQRPDAIT